MEQTITSIKYKFQIIVPIGKSFYFDLLINKKFNIFALADRHADAPVWG